MDAYLKLAEKMDRPGDASYLNYLNVLMSPEEAELLVECLTPTTCEQLAKRLKVDEESLRAKLDDLTRRGLLFKGKTEYVCQYGMHGYFASLPHLKDKDLPTSFWRAWTGSFKRDQDNTVANRIKNLKERGIPQTRLIPSRLAILASPKIRPEQVLWYEDMAQILAREPVIGVVECDCRRRLQNCDRPLWNCLLFDEVWVEYELKMDRKTRKLSLEEGIAASDLAEMGGLLHNAPNFAGMPGGIMCHCCPCCCGEFKPIFAAGLEQELLAPSRFLAVVDEGLCTGCQECVERCPFQAIEMQKPAGSKKLKAHIINEKCKGCGVCVVGCKQKALTFELVRPPEHIPSQPPFPRRILTAEELFSTPAREHGTSQIVRWLK